MKQQITCDNCGKTFTAYTDNRRFCSMACRRTVPDRPCVICGTVFYDSHAQVLCCSMKCSALYKRRKRQQEVEQRFGGPIYDLLHRLYHVEQMPVRAVAQLLGVSSRNLFEWFYDLSIPRRDRTTAVAMQWIGNDARRAATADLARRTLVSNDLEERRQRSAVANAALQERRGPTSIERLMMAALDAAGLVYEAQYTIGGKFVCDIVFPDAMLVVECDGTYWHNTPRQRRVDASKNAYLYKCGYTVMRFSDVQIRQDVHACVRAITAFVTSL